MKAIRILKYLFQREYRMILCLKWYLNIKQKKQKSFITKILVRKLYDILYVKYRVVIGKNALIHSSIQFPHFQNIVIGDLAEIDEGCIIYQDVTIGCDSKGKYPSIGKNVIIYPGSKVFGGIKIGDNVIIGANSVVNHDIPSNVVVAGVPARIIKRYEM